MCLAGRNASALYCQGILWTNKVISWPTKPLLIGGIISTRSEWWYMWTLPCQREPNTLEEPSKRLEVNLEAPTLRLRPCVRFLSIDKSPWGLLDIPWSFSVDLRLSAPLRTPNKTLWDSRNAWNSFENLTSLPETMLQALTKTPRGFELSIAKQLLAVPSLHC